MAQKVSSLAIDINVTGAPQASAQLDKVEKSGRKVTDALQKLVRANADYAAATAIAAVAVKKLLDAAESYNRINSRLALVTKDSADLANVQSQLFSLAQKTGTEFESLVGLYSKLALNAKTLGASQSDLLRVTESVSKALQVSGTSAAAAAGSTTQFVQLLGSSRVQAEELNSILDGNAFLAQAIAKGLGLTPGQLREAVKEGRVLNTDVLGAVLRQTGDIDAAFNKLGDTMERSGTRLANSFNKALASIDSKIGLSRSLTGLFNAVSASLDQGIGKSLAALATGGTTGLITSLAESKTSTSSRPLVNRAGQLAPVRVTADRPKPRTGGTGPGRTASAVDGFSSVSSVSTGRNFLQGVGDQGSPIDAIEESITAQFGPLQERLSALSAGVGQTLVDSLANGITAAVQSGSIGEGFKELGKTLLGGLGAQVRDFGIASLNIAGLMKGLFASLASFIPGGAIGASVALIAAGSALVGLAGRGARRSFGTTNTGVNRGATSGSTIIERGSIGLPSSIYTPQTGSSGASGSVASASAPVFVNATIIGYNDPRAQRDIQELVKRGAARGSV